MKATFEYQEPDGAHVDAQGWFASHNGNECTGFAPIVSDGDVVALVVVKGDFDIFDSELETRAKFVGTACNAHDELVAALEEMTGLVDTYVYWNGTVAPLERARAALAKAGAA